MPCKCCAARYCAVLLCAALLCAALRCAVLRCAVLCFAVLQRASLCWIMPCALLELCCFLCYSVSQSFKRRAAFSLLVVAISTRTEARGDSSRLSRIMTYIITDSLSHAMRYEWPRQPALLQQGWRPHLMPTRSFFDKHTLKVIMA